MANPKAPDRSSRAPKVLRVGIVDRDRIIDEREIPARRTISIGTSERNDFVVSGPGVPAKFELFQYADGGYLLNFTESMTGRVAIPIGQGELTDLRRSGHARSAGAYHQVSLDDASRGRIRVGDVSVVFQFVDPSPAAVRPALPEGFTGGLGGNVDWTFAAFVNGSFLFFFGFGLVLSQLDPVVESGIRTIPDDLAHLVVEEPEPPEVQQETQQNQDSDAPADEPEPTHDDSRSTSNESAHDVANNAEAQASLTNDVANQVMSELLGAANGDATAGVFRDLLGAGNVEGNLGEQLQTAGGTVAAGSGSRVHEAGGGGGSGTTGELGTLQGGSGPRTNADTGSGPAEVAVRRAGTTRASGSTEIGGTGTFDSAQVSSRLRSLQASINRCYEQQLATNSTLEGRVGVQFTITESGGVTSVQVDAPSAALGSCVSSVLGRMRFNPAPVGGSVRYSTAFVFSSSG